MLKKVDDDLLIESYLYFIYIIKDFPFAMSSAMFVDLERSLKVLVKVITYTIIKVFCNHEIKDLK